MLANPASYKLMLQLHLHYHIWYRRDAEGLLLIKCSLTDAQEKADEGRVAEYSDCSLPTSKHLIKCSLPALTTSLSSLEMSCFLDKPYATGKAVKGLSMVLICGSGGAHMTFCFTMEAEHFRPCSEMMSLVSLASISSGTETLTAGHRATFVWAKR